MKDSMDVMTRPVAAHATGWGDAEPARLSEYGSWLSQCSIPAQNPKSGGTVHFWGFEAFERGLSCAMVNTTDPR